MEGNDQFKYFHDRTDLQGFVGYQLRGRYKVAIGYQYRIQPGIDNHRSIQQVSWSNSQERIKLNHRIRADQTFETGASDQWRLRYRFQCQKSFIGGSAYIMLSDELIYAYQPEFDLKKAQKLSYRNKMEISI